MGFPPFATILRWSRGLTRIKAAEETSNFRGDARTKEAAGVASRRSLLQDAITKRLGLSYEGLSSAALLTAALLAAAAFLTATAPLASATLLLALALLAFTFLFIPIFLLAATALLSATALLAALLSSAFRFDGFIRITFCFHSTFLNFSY
jgi:hypothetical protein